MSRRAVMGSVILALVLAALNQTMVSTAMPRIVASLGGMDLYSWVFSAYMLSATVFVPVFGKLSDLFGRRPLLLMGIALFTLGALLAGTAQDMVQLIAYRALQGLGASAMMPVAFAVVADLYPPAERGRSQGFIGAAFGLASFVGPLAGGWITDNSSWHWAFLVNVPVGLLTLGYSWVVLPHKQRAHGAVAVDYAGAALMVAATTPLLLLASLGGKEFAWSSPESLGLAALSLVCAGAFLAVERRAQDPILPLRLFKNAVFAVSAAVSLLIGVLMFGNTMFIPLFVQGVIGTSATAAGMIMTPMMLSHVGGSMLSGMLASRTGRYRVLAIAGLLLMALGQFLLMGMSEATRDWQAIAIMAIAGCGLGVTMPLFVLAVQNAVDPRHLGSVTSLIQFFRSMGGTLGVAGLGAVLTHHTTSELRAQFPAVGPDQLPNPQILLAPGAASRLGEAMASALRDVLAHGLHSVFLFGLGLVGVALALTFLLEEIPLRKTHAPPLQEATEELAAEGFPGLVMRPEDAPDRTGRSAPTEGEPRQ